MERVMQYVWQHRLFSPIGLKTVDGRRLSIINPGLLNTGPGPDFFNAAVEIDGQKWVGNVEIHVRASDWHRHGHDADPAYHSVILHVVDFDDTLIRRPDGQAIPQMQLQCSPELHIHFQKLVGTAPSELTCAETVRSLPRLYLTDWLASLAYERLHAKADRILSLLERYAGDWESAAYVTTARALGMGINAEPFERLARSLPLQFIRKHADNPLSVEALFFGQAGLIPLVPSADNYVESLRTEYAFLANKFGLQKPEGLGWKFSGIRPANNPHRRVAYLAMLAAESRSILASVKEVADIEQARAIFAKPLPGYWGSHYSFAAPRQESSSGRPLNSEVLVINAVAPLMFAYGNYVGDTAMADRAVELLQALPAEKNRLVDVFASAGIKPDSAFSSQALIQLRREYCEQRKCIYCRFGHRHLSAAATR